MRRAALIACLVLAALGAAGEARAGGFMIKEHSALATGMANARTALWDDPSSLFFNPAAITQLEGFQISLGDTLIFPSITYDPSMTTCPTDSPDPSDSCGLSTKGEFKVFTPLHVYFTARITNWLAAGISLNNPFGLGTFWPEGWDGRYTAYQTDLKTFFVQPSVAVDFARLAHMSDDVSLSFALTGYYVHGVALIKQKVDSAPFFPEATCPGCEAEMTMEGDGNSGGYGFALFAAWKPWVSFGASVRSNVPLHFAGTASFTAPAEPWADTMRALGIFPESTPGSTDIELPWNMNFGLAFHGLRKWTFAADLYVELWESYDELKVHFECSEDGSCAGVLNEEAVYPKKWSTAIQASFGTEYRPIEAIAVRLGAAYVSDPTHPDYYDAMLPDGDRLLLTAGFGYRAPKYFKVDLGYMFAYWRGVKDNDVGAEDPGQRNGLANGTYTTATHLLAITLGFSFGGPHKGVPQTLDSRPDPKRPAVLPAPTAEPIASEPAAVTGSI
ncbi:MAG: outer membrane protein transport protein [Deltaproteobacteria bacterium]|nr:outer membrane protein transport protein [Deltaproteobacteria bacterium]